MHAKGAAAPGLQLAIGLLLQLQLVREAVALRQHLLLQLHDALWVGPQWNRMMWTKSRRDDDVNHTFSSD